jgi:hypothetical protein
MMDRVALIKMIIAALLFGDLLRRAKVGALANVSITAANLFLLTLLVPATFNQESLVVVGVFTVLATGTVSSITCLPRQSRRSTA